VFGWCNRCYVTACSFCCRFRHHEVAPVPEVVNDMKVRRNGRIFEEGVVEILVMHRVSSFLLRR